MELKGTSLIGYSRGKEGGEKWQAFDPNSNEILLPYYISANRTEVNQAAILAKKAFAKYGKLSGKKKAAFLYSLATKLEQTGEDLHQRIDKETGLGMHRILSEKARTCHQIRVFAKLVEEGSWVNACIDVADPTRKPKPRPDLRSMFYPIGPVAVFCASNFPLAFSVLGGDTISAFAAGNPVIVNAHHAHPGTSEMIGLLVIETAREHDLPEGVFSLLYGANFDVGQWLVKHPEIQAVGFTGSKKGGLALSEIAAARPTPIPVFAEMSSLNPVFILPEILKQKGKEIAEGLFASVTLGSGQFCTKPGLVIMQNNSEYEKMLQTMTSFLEEAPTYTLLAPYHKKNYANDIFEKYVVPGEIDKLTTQRDHTKLNADLQTCRVHAEFFKTNAPLFLAHPEFYDETFGPSTLFVSCQNANEMLEIALQAQGQLTVSIFGTDEDLKNNYELIDAAQQKAGRVILNDFPTGVEVNDSIVHGGPFPSTSDGRTTSVGTRAITRFVRPVCFQNMPDFLLPDALKEKNPLEIRRKVNGISE